MNYSARNDWRGMRYFMINGHQMYRMSEEEMGGGCSGISIGCVTCGTDDSSLIQTYEFWDSVHGEPVYTLKEALLQANKDMWKHAHPERQK